MFNELKEDIQEQPNKSRIKLRKNKEITKIRDK
jgi:hypothetical protein